jgi:hypothetical protein
MLNKIESRMDCEKAKELLDYNMRRGEFTWPQRIGEDRATKIFNSKHAGKKAGMTCPRGYVYIHIRGHGKYLAHRLAWLIVTGHWPHGEIDHCNGDPSNNAWYNLRGASRAENAANRGVQKNSSSGVKGVYWRQDKQKWTAQIAMNRKVRKLGYFSTKDAAKAAYDKAAREIHGEFARTA